MSRRTADEHHVLNAMLFNQMRDKIAHAGVSVNSHVRDAFHVHSNADAGNPLSFCIITDGDRRLIRIDLIGENDRAVEV